MGKLWKYIVEEWGGVMVENNNEPEQRAVEDMEKRKKEIENLKRRLRWLTFEAADEEFDVDEVKIIVEQLKKLDSVDLSGYINV